MRAGAVFQRWNFGAWAGVGVIIGQKNDQLLPLPLLSQRWLPEKKPWTWILAARLRPLVGPALLVDGNTDQHSSRVCGDCVAGSAEKNTPEWVWG